MSRDLEERCMHCRFFDRDEQMNCEDMDKGLCKRFPPVASYCEEDNSVTTCWPMVDWLDWCRGWRAINEWT